MTAQTPGCGGNSESRKRQQAEDAAISAPVSDYSAGVGPGATEGANGAQAAKLSEDPWPLGDQHGYSIRLCTCDNGPYLGARQMGQVCTCERCRLMTPDQWEFIRDHVATEHEAEVAALRGERDILVQSKQQFVDHAIHYRNLAVVLGAKPEQMLSEYDRGIAAEPERARDEQGSAAYLDEDSVEAWAKAEATEATLREIRALADHWARLAVIAVGSEVAHLYREHETALRAVLDRADRIDTDAREANET